MSAKYQDNYNILATKLFILLKENGFSIEKNFAKKSHDNTKNIEKLLRNISFSELQKYNILINGILNEKRSFHSSNLFEEFAIVFTEFKKHNLETGYLEKILKNFAEEDYSESIINVGKALESLSKSILKEEEENDNLNKLLYLLIQDGKVTNEERTYWEQLRNYRNENAHGDEVFVEISKNDAQDYILLSFEMMKNVISRI